MLLSRTFRIDYEFTFSKKDEQLSLYNNNSKKKKKLGKHHPYTVAPTKYARVKISTVILCRISLKA